MGPHETKPSNSRQYARMATLISSFLSIPKAIACMLVYFCLCAPAASQLHVLLLSRKTFVNPLSALADHGCPQPPTYQPEYWPVTPSFVHPLSALAVFASGQLPTYQPKYWCARPPLYALCQH
eukprot:182601-Pelagomonas_calceolata.AAC.1